MTKEELEAEIVEAAQAWVEARRAYEASQRVTTRPENYSQLKGDIRRAERTLRGKVEALERLTETSPAPSGSPAPT